MRPFWGQEGQGGPQQLPFTQASSEPAVLEAFFVEVDWKSSKAEARYKGGFFISFQVIKYLGYY